MAPNATKSAAGKKTLFEGHINEDRNTSFVSAQDQTLLKALQNLIVRVVDPKQTNDMDQIPLGPEATKLIVALQEFISGIIGRSQSRAQNIIEVNLDDEEDGQWGCDRVDDGKEDPLPQTSVSQSDGDTNTNSNSNNLIALQTPQPTFEEKLMEALREHVFNKMPIRLLSFEQYESNLQISLLERGAVYTRIASVLRRKMHDEALYPRIRRTDLIETDDKAIKRLISEYAKYAILSHTWLRTASASEVTYADWNKRFLDPNDPAYRKLVNFCKAAWKDHQLAFGWMDTVCINKDSSSELDESIRSMYNWYERADVCIVYLAETVTLSNMPFDHWFTRGWTLQELLAPRVIKFYNNHWQPLVNHSDNDKEDIEITSQVEQATTISKKELADIRKAPISRRMQLAAARQVTREEDTAYSLMGIFNVSISTAYGEGAARAFFRLLQEILLSSPYALGLLNWAGTTPDSRPHTSFILPSSPKNFTNRSSNNALILRWPIEPLTLTHLGLRLPVILMPGVSIQDPASQRSTFGAYYATVDISPIQYEDEVLPTSYNLLDNRVTGKDGRNKNKDWYQMTFAVFNFSATSDDKHNIIRLPKTCLALGLWCDEPAGKISPLGRFTFIRTHEPIVFELNRATIDENHHWNGLDERYWHIKRAELVQHGMQLISLYL